MLPISVYRTSRPWWRRRWQAEPNDTTYCERAVTAFTERGAFRKAIRAYERTWRGPDA